MRQFVILAISFCCIVSLTPNAISADAKSTGKAGKSKKHQSPQVKESTPPAGLPATDAVSGKAAAKPQPAAEKPAAQPQPAIEKTTAKPQPEVEKSTQVLEEFRALPATEEPKPDTAESAAKVAPVLEEFRSMPAKEEPKPVAATPTQQMAPQPAAPVAAPTLAPIQKAIPATPPKAAAAPKTTPVEAAPKAAPQPKATVAPKPTPAKTAIKSLTATAKAAAAPPIAKPAEVAATPTEKKAPAPALPEKAATEKKAESKPAAPPIVKGVVSGQTFIDIQAGGPISNFKVSKLEEPARLLIDIPGATSSIRGKSLDIDKFGITKVRIGGNPRFLRIVLDAKQAKLPAYKVISTDSGLRIEF